jgi:TrmH family RNA methyltransferase
MISSTTNPKVKFVRRLQRDKRFRQRERAFVIEGTRWLQDVAQEAVVPLYLFYTTSWAEVPHQAQLLDEMETEATLVSDEVLAAMSDTETPAGVLAVLPQPSAAPPENRNRLLILDRLRDPGNLGTLLRTAAAAGVDAVLLAPGSVDPFNPKVVRASMGALLRIPALEMAWDEIGAYARGLDIWIAAAGGERAYWDVDWRRPAALVVGSEAHGAGPRARALARGTVRIPMAGDTESLNAAMAAGIILFEAVRQRGTQ